MPDCVARIDKLINGYTVEIYDEKVAEENRKPKSDWKDPWKEYAFSTADEVKDFIGKHLDALKPAPAADVEYADAFKAATAED